MAKHVESRGCSLAFKVDGAGDPAVFIQGVGLHGDGWIPQIETLRSQHRCLTFDNRGIGQSQPAGTRITVGQMADDTLKIMDAAGIGSAHVIGHSLGGAVALQVALTARQRVVSLSLLCTSSCGAHATRLTFPLIWLGLRSRLGTRRMRSRAFLEMVMPPEYLATQDRDLLAARLQPLFGHDLADSPPIVMRQLQALKRFDVTARLPELAGMPVLVLSAAQDLIFPAQYGRELADRITGARFVEFAGAAHGVTIQCAETVNRILLDWFASPVA